MEIEVRLLDFQVSCLSFCAAPGLSVLPVHREYRSPYCFPSWAALRLEGGWGGGEVTKCLAGGSTMRMG